jgi:1,4-alpha-glucan branching enzyme
VDWDRHDEFRGIIRLYRDLIRLRLNRDGRTRGLCGHHVHISHVHDDMNVIAFHRWDAGGPHDDVMVVANFHRDPRKGYTLGFPSAGTWKLLFNSDWKGYSTHFGDFASRDVTATAGEYDNLPARADVDVGAYSVLIYGKA